MRITYEHAEELTIDSAGTGYCPDCDELIEPGDSYYEPDAEGYPCNECGGRRAMGFDFAFMSGLVEVE